MFDKDTIFMIKVCLSGLNVGYHKILYLCKEERTARTLKNVPTVPMREEPSEL